MTIFLLPALAIAFAAFCVWLTVRTFNRRERWAKWTLVTTLGLPVLYVLSFGPWCWAVSRTVSPGEAPGDTLQQGISDLFYQPLLLLWWTQQPIAEEALEWYANVFADHRVSLAGLPIEASEDTEKLILDW